MDPALPIEGLDAEQEVQRCRDSGAGDVRLGLEVNFLGALTVDREAFGEHDPRWIAGAGLRVVAPMEGYQSDKLLNLGSNRWSLAYPITPSQGIVLALGSAVTYRAAGDYDTISIGYQYA